MKMVVGLGNPGRKYVGTRHNVGFLVLDELQARFGASGGGRRNRFESEQIEIGVHGERVLLVWPQTFMNLSGSAVQPTRDFFKIEPENILIVCDDFSLPLGRLRFRAKGSSGGQKGLGDILTRLGTTEISRLRLGIGAPAVADPVNYVLGRFAADELNLARSMVTQAATAVEEWIERGIAYCMNRWNGEGT